MATISVTHSAPTNIACIKYWGKKDVKLNTPINSSVSVTMNQDDLKAITTIVASPSFEKDRLWLNGIEEDPYTNPRVVDVLKEIRARAGDRADNSGKIIPASELSNWKVHIISKNTFPTAAGLASSAAGYACLVHTLADVYGVKESYVGELSTIARKGSGSACRSLYGGFVRWQMGDSDKHPDASDSMAIQVADEKHWPELAVLICVVSDKKKDTGSTDGMSRSVATSPLLKHRAQAIVPDRLANIEQAYRNKDFETFAALTMMDSNQFHATCLDTYPPVFYMNDVSKKVIGLVHKINEVAGRTVCGYTFDAGPNAVIFTLREHVAMILAAVKVNFPLTDDITKPFVSSEQADAEAQAFILENKLPAALVSANANEMAGAIRHVYYTTAGDGPRVLTDSDALADKVTGMPFYVAEKGNKGEFSKAL